MFLFLRVPVTYRGFHSSITTLPQLDHYSARTSPELRQNFARTSPELRQNFARTSPELRQNFARTPPELRQNFARTSPELRQNFPRILVWVKNCRMGRIKAARARNARAAYERGVVCLSQLMAEVIGDIQVCDKCCKQFDNALNIAHISRFDGAVHVTQGK